MFNSLRQNKLAFASVLSAGAIAILAIFAPFFTSFTNSDPYTYHLDLLDDMGVPKNGATFDHWFGVEPRTGRDLFAIVIFGARTSLVVGFFASIIALFIGVIVGVIAGYTSGKIDSVLSKLTDVMLVFPGLIFMIAISAIVPQWFPRTLLMVLIIGLFGWAGIARVVRAETLKLSRDGYVQFSKMIGGKTTHIVFTHLLSNLIPTILVYAAISIPAKITAEATLSFLGVGITPPTPTWGRTIADAVTWINTDPLYLAFPALFLFIITLSLNIFGDFLRDLLDPNLTTKGQN